MAHGRLSTAFDGDSLRKLRERGGMSLRALAARCKTAGTPVSDSQLSKIERGVCRPRPALMATLATVLEVKVNALIQQDKDQAA
ncbi:helix-turn-helix domain-containing protein [Actinophytocola sediminis]